MTLATRSDASVALPIRVLFERLGPPTTIEPATQSTSPTILAMQSHPNAAAHGSSHAQRDTGIMRDDIRQDVDTSAGMPHSALAGNPAPGEDAAGKGRSHATGKSIVPEVLQQVRASKFALQCSLTARTETS